MSSRTAYMDKSTVTRLCNRYPATMARVGALVEVAERSAANVESDLRARGEHELAERWLGAVAAIRRAADGDDGNRITKANDEEANQ